MEKDREFPNSLESGEISHSQCHFSGVNLIRLAYSLRKSRNLAAQIPINSSPFPYLNSTNLLLFKLARANLHTS